MKRFWSVLLTVCLVFSTLVAVLTITAFASNHVEKDKGLVISSYRAANLKNYGSDIYQTEKHLDSVPISFEAWVYLESSISGDAGVIIGNHSAKAGGRFSFKII